MDFFNFDPFTTCTQVPSFEEGWVGGGGMYYNSRTPKEEGWYPSPPFGPPHSYPCNV